MGNEEEFDEYECNCTDCPFEGIPSDGDIPRAKIIQVAGEDLGLRVVDGLLCAVYEEVV